MAQRTHIELSLPDEDATRRVAERLAPLLDVGDVLLLSGEIGAGKTAFARALIQARLRPAGRLEDVPSPTFTLIQTYDDGVAEIVHADLYRLGALGETDELGLEEAFDTAICLVEWPDRLEGTAPGRALSLDFALTETEGARWLVLDGAADVWGGRLQQIAALQEAVAS
ncbi:tRNA (adenosine(37)-N6)-threonylcarbamoyltransferase complex ATPase subunit type 1 TsaE [Ovoidimarina sediminis]|uniref:tRNA (adenosine(37)-N6)-threonylcarbamoyltransferase complex ATPase subunit type 1 TsaE n=1 Tax=Ovoidimarina sediminis TaxID=3079856 RepID=UPI00290E395F|nr:tRNA (adenosine(37)-N6)-threonylcarbamoyltransferase complex ATPase subunit type 1 TsaE [Rhodophyticola sp. MJ-SS7]MDU8942516.1 tRNA (adenosine(37)-N6)-threonylcarbamoyltransferase complex ATPase subunit type 1 TsaE [Rhodophyticola sp. MJ-SS7]